MKKTPTSSVVPGFRTGERLAITALSLATLALAHTASAQTTTTWSGGGGDNNWGTGANWGGSPPPVGTTSDLVFAGTTRTNPFNNYTAFDDFRNIFFASGAGTFSITGNAIDLFGKIENNSTNTQTFALDLGVNTSFVEINPVQGNLNINSANIFLNSNQLRIYGNNGRTVSFSTGTVISGSGGSVALLENSTAVMAGNNTYTGGTTIGAGRLVIGTNFTTNVSGVHTAGALGTGSLTLSNGVTLVADQGSTIRSNISSTTFLKGDVTVGASNSAGLRMASSWDMDGTTRTITLGKASTNYSSGNEVIGFINAGGIAPTFGNGTLALATTTGSTSNPSIARFATATFTANAGLSIGDGVAITTQNGSFFATGASAPSLTLAADAGRGGGILQMGDGISGGAATMRSATVFSLSGGGLVSSANTTGTAATGTLTINNGNNAVFSGRITEAGGTGIIAVTKSGAGTQTFSGSNGHTGLTTVSAGALRAANANALGATNGSTTVSSGATLELSNGITISDEALSLNGTGVGSLGALRSVSGNNSYLGPITQAGTSYYGADTGASLTISNVAGGTTELWIVGDGNTTIAGSATNTGTTAFVKTNTGTAILMASNNWGGNEFIRRGTVIISNNNALGSAGTTTLGQNSTADNATLQIGQNIVNSNALNIEFGTGIKTLSYQSSSGTGSQLGSITINNSSLAFNIASGGSLLFGGGVSAPSGVSDVSRLAIDGGGTLIVTNAASGIASTDRYQVRIGNGTLVIGSGTIVARTNTSGLGHGLDLGVDLNGSAVSATSSIRASNSVTVSNAIFVSTTGGNARVLGASGANASVTFSGPIGLAGTTALTLDATNGQNVAVSGAITNFTGGTGSLIKTGGGTATLSGANTFSGKTTVSGGTLSINAEARLGAAPASWTADQLTLNGGTLESTASFVLNTSTNRGITLASSGGTISVASGQRLQVTNTATVQSITGAGSLTKAGSGTLSLGGSNNFSGGFILNSGGIHLTAGPTASGGVLAASALGTGDITINGGVLLGSQDFVATNILINGSFGVNDGATGGLNGRVGLVGTINNAGLTNTVSLGRWQTAAGALRTDGNGPSLRFTTNGGFAATITNGSMRFVRQSSGTASDFVGLNFNATNFWATGSGLIIGTNVVTSFNGANMFAAVGSLLPAVTLEGGAYLSLGNSNNANSQLIRSLSGSAGIVTSLATLGATNTATLTISNQAGDNATFGGQMVDGSSLNGTLGTTATNTAFALVKSGQGTQVLSGNNTYGGPTTISAGVLTFANTNAKSANSQVTVQSNAVIGLGVGGAGGYDEATITSIISNTATGYTMNVGSIVGIDTTAGNFSYGTGIANSRELWKLGANTLTLTAGSGRTGATAVAGGTLELNATSGQAAGGTSGITVRSGATLLIAKSDQVNDAAAITLSGGTIAKGSGVSETMGDLSLTAASTLDYGTGTAGTLTFGTYAPSALTKLTLNNFGLANTLRFVGSDLSSFIVGSYSGTSFSNDYFNINGMDFGFTSSWDSGSSTFTITSVPEPSTVLAALGLTGLLGWPVLRRRLRRKA